MPAAPDAVMAVLQDFANIGNWSRGVKKSYTINNMERGVGAERHCDFVGAGSPYFKERLTGATDNSITVTVFDANQPLKEMVVHFDVQPASAGTGSEVTIRADYAMKFGPLGRLMEILMANRSFAKALAGLLKDLDTAATEVATTP